ncbi:MAG: hypothetical protein IPI04_16235 [Ignavibacteria bacterium]|nr:hypothetical protein [Ignavibacteria bacterium]
MENTKLIKLLKSLSKSEIFRFRDFVSSPYYNKNQNVIKLCEKILNFYPGFDPVECNRRKIYSGSCLEREVYNYFKIKNIISDLYQPSSLFLKLTAVEKKGIENEIALLNELHERKLDSLYLFKEKQINKYFNDVPVKDEFFYQAYYQLARVNTSHVKFIKQDIHFDLIPEGNLDNYVQYTLIVLCAIMQNAYK